MVRERILGTLRKRWVQAALAFVALLGGWWGVEASRVGKSVAPFVSADKGALPTFALAYSS